MKMRNLGILCVFTLITIIGCEKPTEFTHSDNNKIVSFTVAYAAQTSKSYSPVFSDFSKSEIQFKVPQVDGAKLTEMKVNITIPPSATISPAFSGKMDFSKPYRFSVIAENGSKMDYLLLVYN